ncbi:hypothetical protein ACP8HI_04335 [Paenibacillus sp. FA6]|uniref:hypothetical protein n=1 Tax=Paenibacillus sp. FA6 TaxID=3413029 RepID=UPI003F65C998
MTHLFTLSNGIVSWLGIWAGVFISGILIFYGYRYQFSKAPLENQLKLVYLPMFVLLEPDLYKPSNEIGITRLRIVAAEISTIVQNHYELVDPSIVHWSRLFRCAVDKDGFSHEEITEHYIHLCQLVDREFERTRKKMHLPTRDIYYRINNDQFTSKSRLYLSVIFVAIPPILGFIGVGFLLGLFMVTIDKLIK